ncbi:serine-rich adhesin for platelets isoform X15 [Drosophila pseudoobscura]|uniref:Serine-rich adhesin for platelets isoform X15 n=1 Tax=Drosophila pseudoobscura pseudoobscura TaxID=46245 RepID=A0A6I8VVJ5_DROPS|nr:serine-rich adhesin for platelets isoform X15 [Drosophila pseudoobscura]
MDLSLERDSSALGSLFQQIINDMKNTSPLWDDFVAKASKLHTCLRAAIQAIAAYLDAFQKIADAATNSRGASKEIGTALTRVCLRHKAVETRLKTFTSAIMDCLVQPLQDKIEDWKRTVATIDKDHAKEYKRCRSELKKRSSDTLRLQKKARKGQTDGLQSLMDSHMQDVTLRRAELEEVEKRSLRAAMVEERLRYCSFVHMLQPVVHEECEVMSELGHLQEAMQSIALVTKEPSVLPQASEELIHDAKASINLYPESPGGGSGSQGGGCSNSLGSRKSSVCSISSMNSSGSSNSPGHHHYPRSLSQFVTPAIRLKPGESSDSGFCSSPALTTQVSNATNQTANVSTWPPHSQDVVDTLPPTADRPHTISTAYEKGHQRPPLTVYTFQNPETIHESGSGNGINNGSVAPSNGQPSSGQTTPATQKSPAASLSRPPLPVRCSSLERPLSAQSNHRQGSGSGGLLQRQCPSPIPAHITKGTPSGSSISTGTGTGAGLGFVYQVSSPTPPTSEVQVQVLKISEQAGSQPPASAEDTDERSRASVLQKASMFEKQAAAVAAAAGSVSPPVPATGPSPAAAAPSAGGPKRSEAEQQEMDKSFEDSIKALNNLIGELDSFQREIDEGKGKQNSNSNSSNNNLTTSSSSSENNNLPAACIGSTASTTNIDLCGISNQTNSSGCGTDMSDTTSEELAGEEGGHLMDPTLAEARRRERELLGASDSELSRCYVSETSSLTGGLTAGGYENPTFAHFVASASRDDPYNGGSGSEGRSLYAPASVSVSADSISLAASDSICLSGQPRHAYVDTCSDSGSAVVVIYDHQIPNTPDIEFVKQNSEIVLLRTKDPQVQSQLQLHEMRELQQLPSNLVGSPDSPDSGSGKAPPPATATVAPAKQRLSSFRASSEQQLQLLGRGSPQRGKANHVDQPPQQQQPAQGTVSDNGSLPVEPPVMRRQLPPKPTSLSLSLFNGTGTGTGSGSGTGTGTGSNQPPSVADKPLIPRKSDFKADLDAKIRRQKQKVQQQLQQQQQQQQKQQQTPQQPLQHQQQQQQHSPQSHQTRNCNVTNGPAAAVVIASASDPILSPHPYQNQKHNQNHRMPSQNQTTATSNHKQYQTPQAAATATSKTSASPPSATIANPALSSLSPRGGLPQPSSSSSSSSSSLPSSASASTNSTSTNALAPLPVATATAPCRPPPSAPPPAHPYVCSSNAANPQANHQANTNTNSTANANANASLKPGITPRPASLSGGAGGALGGAGGSTRIARRSSINQAKPPPPVRRSSSVTPSPNASVGHASHLQLQHNTPLSSSSEHLPPPPAFMLESMSSGPPVAMPSSALKVSETVRALAAMRHQPASPGTLRRIQQQQQQQHQQQPQQQQYQPPLQSVHNSPMNDDPSYEAYYDSYMDLQAYAHALANGQQQQPGQQMPPPLPPPNQQRFNHQQQQQQYHPQQCYPQQQQQQQHVAQKPPTPPVYHAPPAPPPTADATFRTSSPAAGGGGGGGIYAQPKLVNSMSSFRTSSPSPNGHGHGHAHPLPPTQPKANPNLIAQLNARLNSKQQQQHHQQQHASDGIYGNQHQLGGESIYTRSGLSMSQPQQQQHYDAAAPILSMRQAQQQQQQYQHLQQQHYTCPPPLEDPPPPPIYNAGASATMPKKMARPHAGQSAASQLSAYAAGSATATLPKNMMQQQQRLQQQQQQQHQQYQQPAGMGNGNGHVNQRPQLPLPQQQMQQQQKLRAAQQQHLAEQQQQQQQRQPPIPSRHSSVQQKIFVSTNPFIQTTAVKFHSPSASPTCGSPVTGSGSVSSASIYATTARGNHHHQQQHQQQIHHPQQQQHQQQQHYYREVAGGNSNGGAAYYNHNNAHGHGHANANAHANVHAHAHMSHAQAHHPNYATSTNIEKTGSIRAKTKAEFLENLNAKLAKQGMSGRAFAVRNLINSKALMYQNPQNLSRPSAQYRRPPTYPNTTTTTSTTATTTTAIGTGTGHCDEQC